jgi:5-hydroxyisourate hydrolase-like protein (transthyretin family)
VWQLEDVASFDLYQFQIDRCRFFLASMIDVDLKSYFNTISVHILVKTEPHRHIPIIIRALL